MLKHVSISSCQEKRFSSFLLICIAKSRAASSLACDPFTRAIFTIDEVEDANATLSATLLNAKLSATPGTESNS